MNIVITCGHPYSGFQSVHTLLTEAGLAQVEVSRQEGMGTSEFHQRVLAAHGVDLAVPASLAPVTPGRVWDGLAVDLFLGNLDAPDWGWADPGAVWLLDFWSQFDPQIRFVLVYAAPDLVVAEMLRQGALSPDGIAQAMASWVAYHAELLRFFHRHRDRSILVDITAATCMPRGLVTKAVDNFGLGLDPSRIAQDIVAPPTSALDGLLVGGLIPHGTEAGTIYAELEGTADLSNDRDASPANLVDAWNEYRHILARLDQGAKELQAATVAQGVAEAKRAESEAKATAENELLLLQLHEVQVELEQYDLRCQTLEEGEKQRQALAKQLAEKQTELAGQVTARKQVEQLLAESALRTEDISRQLIAAKSAYSATETTLRQQADAALATERAKQAELAGEIKRLQARVAEGETAAKQLVIKQKELNGQIAGRKQAEQLLSEAARRTEDLSQALLAAKSAHSATETTLRQQADAALATERAKQAELTGEIKRLQARVAEGETAAKQLVIKQKELDGQLAGRKRAEQLLSEAARRTEDLSQALLAEKSAHSATETTLRQQAETAANQLAGKQKELDAQVAGRKQAELLLAEAARRTEDLSREIIAAKSAHHATETALRQAAEKETALSQENELLLAQLQQVQDELKRQHLQSKNASDLRAQVSLPSGVTLKQLTQATVDLRGVIDGDNWYDAEQDGRWAGPGQVSTLLLPALTVGQYQLSLEVVDTIDPDILNGMTLSLNGKPLAIKRRRQGSLTLVTAKFSSETSTPGEKWKMALNFPRLLSPAERGSDDDRTLAVRVRTLSIVPIRTESDSLVADGSASGKWGIVQPTQITFDLRGDIDGDNWYDAEHDGRWAGPGHVSSLMLPALGAGRYQLELDVVDAMAPEIVNGMTLTLNGTPIAIKPDCRGYPTLVTAEFSTDAPAPDGQWELRISFPRVTSPADHGLADHRTLAIRLRTVSVKQIRPEESSDATGRSKKKAKAASGGRQTYRWWGRKK